LCVEKPSVVNTGLVKEPQEQQGSFTLEARIRTDLDDRSTAGD